MKLITISILLTSFNTYAKEAWIKRLSKKNYSTQKKVNRKSKHDSLQRLIENNKRLNAIFQKRTAIPVIWTKEKRVLTGETFSGTLLNPIDSTNGLSPVLVRVDSNQGLAFNTKFSCSIESHKNRVFSTCNKLITENQEIPIKAQLLNLDGSSGLLGEYDDGSEDLIVESFISNFSKGLASAAKNKIEHSFGSNELVGKEILQGAIKSTETTSEILLKDINSGPRITIQSGTKVLIYFMEAINDY